MQDSNINQTHTGTGPIIGRDQYNFYNDQPPPVPHYLSSPIFNPPDPVRGRDKTICLIRAHLYGESPIKTKVPILVLNSMGGVGKTTTALYYLQTYSEQYQHIICLSKGLGIKDSLLNNDELLEALHIAEKVELKINEKKPDAAYAIIINALKSLPSPTLWLIDDADKEALTFIQQLTQTFPTHHFLITTREQKTHLPTMHLDYLEASAALELFLDNCPKLQNKTEEHPIIATIIEKIKQHTLIIVLLANIIEQQLYKSPKQLLKELDTTIIDIEKEIKIDVLQYSDQQFLYEILEKVFDMTEIQKDKPALHLLTQLSVMPSENIASILLNRLLSQETFKEADLANSLNTLEQKSWIAKQENKSDTYTCHQVIQEVIRKKQNVNAQTVAHLIQQLIDTIADNNKNDFTDNTLYLPYAVSIIKCFPQQADAISKLLANTIISFEEMKDDENSLTYLSELLNIEINLLGDKHPTIANIYNSIAKVYVRQQNAEKIEEFYLKAIAIEETIPDFSPADIAISYEHIYEAYNDKGLYNKAFYYCKKTMLIREEHFGVNHITTAISYNNIGLLYQVQGDYTTALNYHKKAVAIREKVLGTEHPTTATSYNNIANIHYAQGDYTTALNYYKKAVAIYEKVLGTEHPNTATSYNNIASIYQAQGDYTTALDYHKKAVAIREKVLGSEHPSTATSYNNIGELYRIQGDYTTALDYFKKDLAICEKVFGTEHPSIAISYNNIANIHYAQGDYPTALNYHKKTIAIREKVLGTEHPDTAMSYNNIASIYEAQGDYATALDYYQKAVTIREKVLGTEHPNTATSYNDIALIYESQGDYTTALNYYQKALTIFKKALPFGHPNTKTVLNNYTAALDKAKETLPPATIQAYETFIQANFSEYL